MFELVLIAQLNTAPVVKPQSLEPVTLPLQPSDTQLKRQNQAEYFKKQQELLNQVQKDYQQDRKRLEQSGG